MPTCGNCKEQGQTIDHIKACFSAKNGTVATVEVPVVSGFTKTYTESRDFTPMAVTPSNVPNSQYALQKDSGVSFYEVRTGKGKWSDFQFVSHLIGHPGDWLKVPVKGASKNEILHLIGQDPKGAAKLFSSEFTVCAVCNSPLSDPVSLETGFGPVCIKRF